MGAGPAGITLALELASARHRVLLIESGSDSYSAEVQQLGETMGKDAAHVPMSLATRRQIGGAYPKIAQTLRIGPDLIQNDGMVVVKDCGSGFGRQSESP